MATDRARCPVCGNADEAAFVRQLSGGYAWWHCQACDLRFSWPMQPGDSSYYQGVWWYDPKVTGRSRRKLHSIAEVWDYRVVLDYEPIPRGQLLDIGCGSGEFLYLARERYGYEVAGFDFNERSIRMARNLYGLRRVICSSWPDGAGSIKRGTFDLVTMFHIVEHLTDPAAAIRAAVLALKPGGMLAVGVPAAYRRPALFAGDVDLPPHHLTLWSEQALERALRAAGLQPVLVARAPLAAAHLLIYWQHRVPMLRGRLMFRPLWAVGRRVLTPVVAIVRSLGGTLGMTMIGIARLPDSGRNRPSVGSAECHDGHRD